MVLSVCMCVSLCMQPSVFLWVCVIQYIPYAFRVAVMVFKSPSCASATHLYLPASPNPTDLNLNSVPKSSIFSLSSIGSLDVPLVQY